MDAQKQQILDFLKAQILGVVSTVDISGGKPEAAVVAFSETENLELIFGTFDDTRKFANLAKNPAVAFAIGWDSVTVQYEGIAKLAEEGEHEACRVIHLAKNPQSKKYVFHEKQRFFRVAPKWIRYSDLSGAEEKTFEISF